MVADGTLVAEVSHKVGGRGQDPGCIKECVKGEVREKMGMFEGIAILTVLYGCDPRALNKHTHTQMKVDLLEVKYLKMICGVRWYDHIKIDTVRESCVKMHSLIERANQGVLKWSRCMDRKNKERVVMRIHVPEVEVAREMRRLRRKRRDKVKEALCYWGVDNLEGVEFSR